QEVALVRRHGLGAERRQVGHDLVDLAVALEGGARPRRREVAPLDQLARGALENGARATGPGPPSEDATNPDTRMIELRLEPAREGAREEHARHVVGRDAEERVHAGFDRPLAQQLGAEGVNGADARGLELRQGGAKARLALGWTVGRLARALERRPEPKLQ